MARIPNFKCPICGTPTAKKNIVKIGYNEYVCKDCIEYTEDKLTYVAEYYHEITKTFEELYITNSGKFLLSIYIMDEDGINNYKLTKEKTIDWCIEFCKNHILKEYIPEYDKEGIED